MKAPSSVKKWALAIAIAIVLNLFVNYGIATFYKSPKYESYCNGSNYQRGPYAAKPYYEAPVNCTFVPVPDNYSKECYGRRGNIQFNYNDSGCATSYFCDTCQAEFEDENDKYNSATFFILLIVGVLSLVAGLLIPVDSVATGLLIGGIISILVGTLRNWGNLTDIIKFLLLGLILALLIGIGYKKVRE